MGNNNINLQSAKNSKDDEFYTTYDTIESELSHYTKHFCNKVVLCNCDDPFESNFCKFFLRNFENCNIKCHQSSEGRFSESDASKGESQSSFFLG